MNEKDLETNKVYEKRPLSKAIKLKCLDCCGGIWEEVKKCTCNDTCFLHPFRLGKNPFVIRASKGNPEALIRYREEKKK